MNIKKTNWLVPIEIAKLIENYKEDVKEYEELLKNSFEDSETNSIRETYIEAYTQFIKDLEELKEYCRYE